jgi:hypothetical protein
MGQDPTGRDSRRGNDDVAIVKTTPGNFHLPVWSMTPVRCEH